jgi:hypothetical protein
MPMIENLALATLRGHRHPHAFVIDDLHRDWPDAAKKPYGQQRSS